MNTYKSYWHLHFKPYIFLSHILDLLYTEMQLFPLITYLTAAISHYFKKWKWGSCYCLTIFEVSRTIWAYFWGLFQCQRHENSMAITQVYSLLSLIIGKEKRARILLKHSLHDFLLFSIHYKESLQLIWKYDVWRTILTLRFSMLYFIGFFAIKLVDVSSKGWYRWRNTLVRVSSFFTVRVYNRKGDMIYCANVIITILFAMVLYI